MARIYHRDPKQPEEKTVHVACQLRGDLARFWQRKMKELSEHPDLKSKRHPTSASGVLEALIAKWKAEEEAKSS